MPKINTKQVQIKNLEICFRVGDQVRGEKEPAYYYTIAEAERAARRACEQQNHAINLYVLTAAPKPHSLKAYEIRGNPSVELVATCVTDALGRTWTDVYNTKFL